MTETEGYEIIEVDEQLIRSMALLGMARSWGDGYELTPRGDEWLRDWCHQKIVNFPTCMCDTTEEGWRPCPPSLCEIPDHKHPID